MKDILPTQQESDALTEQRGVRLVRKSRGSFLRIPARCQGKSELPQL